MDKINTSAPQLREALVRAITDDLKAKRQAEFVISSEAVDTYGTVFRMDGWDLSRYEANPVVAYVHRANDPNPDFILGTGEVFKEGNLLIGRVTFEAEDVNPLAERVWRKIQAGTIRMASINAIPRKWHMGDPDKGEKREVLYFDEQELFEWSVCPLGSNPDALKRNAETVDAIRAELAKEIEVTQERTDENKGLSYHEAILLNNENYL